MVTKRRCKKGVRRTGRTKAGKRPCRKKRTGKRKTKRKTKRKYRMDPIEDKVPSYSEYPIDPP